MKTVLYKADSRGHADHGWLNAWHTFSFAEYHNPQRVHFGLLRVLNDDTVAAGMGFGTHPHDNMEIVTIPLEGALEHSDSTGGKGVISKNEVQVMSAGSGLRHSEYNHSKTEPVKLFQIWVFPKLRDIKPGYDQRLFLPQDRINTWQTVAGGELAKDALRINQDAYFSLASLDSGKSLGYSPFLKGNGVFLMVISGKVEVAGELLNSRDAIGITDPENLSVKSVEASELLMIEVPMQ
jgi:redox-sensitive bicupin YhaK (pirin superfamily)